jgi:hypothetical protein
MRLPDVFKSRLLTAMDIPPEGIDLTVTGGTIETLGRGPEAKRKPLITFSEVDKVLALNLTNGRAIAAVLGDDDMEAWIGRRITLVRTEVEFDGRLVPAIRVRDRPADGADDVAF